MTRALLIVSYQQLRLFVPKTVYYYACIALFSFKLTFVLYSSNVVVCLDKKITGRHQLITPPLPPRLSANEVSKAFACIVPSSRTPLLQAAFIRVDLHLLAARPAISPINHQITNHRHHHQPLYTLAARHHHQHLVRANQSRTCDLLLPRIRSVLRTPIPTNTSSSSGMSIA
jgi:hypothetical protein